MARAGDYKCNTFSHVESIGYTQVLRIAKVRDLYPYHI